MSPRYQITPILRHLYACGDARAWVAKTKHKTFADAWAACPRGDWMLWLAARAGVDRRLVVLAACDCAEPALVYVPAGEDRPRVAIETARRWACGEATTDEVRAYAADAYAANAAAYAANAAAYASDAAYAADAYVANAAAYAANAAAYASDAAYAAAYAVDRSASLARSADLVRARIPWHVVEAGLIDYARKADCLVEIES